MTLSAESPSSENHSGNGQYRVVRKRNRVPLSCAPCRNRKLKCNRSSPCENCVKRGDSLSCSYAASSTRKKSSSSSSPTTSPDDMQNRINRLEGLVLSLMTNGTQSAGPTAAARALSTSTSSHSQDYSPYMAGNEDKMVKEEEEEEEDGESETEQVAKSFGVLHVNNNKSMYIGEAHWGAILNDISEVRNYWSEHKKQYDDQCLKVEASKKQNGVQTQGVAFLFGGRTVQPVSDLLAQLPGRDAVDKLVGRYFNDYDPTMHILHAPSWRRMYEKHWIDPTKTEPVWLGQLFAILCLAMHSYHRADDEPYEYKGRTLSLAANYRALTAQCLLLADFTKPLNYMIETMILHLHGEFARSREAEVGVWVLIGMIVRLSMRMGFHRDPKYYPNLSPFQGEMRRRVWTFVRQSDLLFSFQIGLPSMIRLGDCDTELPRSLFDDEFDEDTKELPPSRSPSTPTPVSYMIAKANLAFSFGKIVECLHCIRTPPYEEVMRLDHDLRGALASLPSHLILRTMEESLLDPVATLMMRFGIEILYHKSQCVLHRRFLSKARENNRYAYSRRTCVDSAMKLLQHQTTLHYESRQGCRLHSVKWYINSLTTHDFLLAATVVCLDLWCSAEAAKLGQCAGEYELWASERRAEMVRALEVSREIWLELRDQSMEAFKASEILGVMLTTLKTMHTRAADLKAESAFQFRNGMNGAAAFASSDEEKPEQQAAMTLGMLSTGGMTPNSRPVYNESFPLVSGNAVNGSDISSGLTPNFSVEQQMGGVASTPSPFSFLTNNGGQDLPITNLDWDAWDNYIQNTTIDSINEIWPTNIDGTTSTIENQNSDQSQQQNNLFGSGGGIFMGLDTPPRSNGI